MATHLHHIVPRHAGGSNDASNLVEVSVEEHAELHLSLYLEHGRWQDWIAYHMLSGKTTDTEWARREAARMYMSNRVVSEETRQKLSDSRKGVSYITPAGRDVYSKKISQAHKRGTYKDNATYCWELTYKDGSIVVVNNLNQYCKENGLYSNHLSELHIKPNGRRKSHKGIVKVTKLHKIKEKANV